MHVFFVASGLIVGACCCHAGSLTHPRRSAGFTSRRVRPMKLRGYCLEAAFLAVAFVLCLVASPVFGFLDWMMLLSVGCVGSAVWIGFAARNYFRTAPVLGVMLVLLGCV